MAEPARRADEPQAGARPGVREQEGGGQGCSKHLREQQAVAAGGGKARAGSGGAEKRSVEEVCADELDEALKQWDGGAPSLPGFVYPASFPRNTTSTGVELRGVPGKEEAPNMLLVGLEREVPLVFNESLLRGLVDAMKERSCALFAVSGQGKTRLSCEALSRQFGLLLVAREPGTNSLNPSSSDVSSTIHEMVKAVSSLDPVAAQFAVDEHVAGLLLARVLVLEKLLSATENGLTAYQWLLAQMYPAHFFKIDVFEEVRTGLMENCDPSKFLRELSKGLKRVSPLIKQPLLSFMDEAQLLSGLCKDRFVSRAGGEKRDLFSAVAKALVVCRTAATGGEITYTTLSGTGFTMVQLVGSVGSSMGKPGGGTFVFTDFKWNEDATHARKFLGLLADLDSLDPAVVEHVCGWLVGRARWSSAFAERWLEWSREISADMDPATLRSFKFYSDPATGPSLTMHCALDAFVAEMCDPKDGFRPESNGRETPRAVIAKLLAPSIDHSAGLQVNRSSLVDTLAAAAMQFACSGKLILLHASVPKEFKAVELVELGLCCVSRSTGSKRQLGASQVSVENRVALAEPLVVEAATRRLPWDKLAAAKMVGAVNNTNEQGRGVAFESCVVPIVDAVFPGEDIQQQAFLSGVDIPGMLKGAWRRGQSACGVLILPCPANEDLEVWMKESRSARFDGQCAPLATPNNMFGADVLVPLRKPSAFCWALFQLKYAKNVDVDGALLTVNPELIHHVNRGVNRGKRQQKPTSAFAGAYKAMFDGAAPAKRKEPVIRALVDFSDAKKRKTSSGKAVVCKKPMLEDLVIDLDHQAIKTVMLASHLGRDEADRFLKTIASSLK